MYIYSKIIYFISYLIELTEQNLSKRQKILIKQNTWIFIASSLFYFYNAEKTPKQELPVYWSCLSIEINCKIWKSSNISFLFWPMGLCHKAVKTHQSI